MAQTNTDPRRAVHFLIVATLGLFVLVLALGALAWVDASNKRADLKRLTLQAKQETAKNTAGAAQVHLVLCALRSDLDRRADAGEREVHRSIAYLKSHPEGIPGIPASLIKSGITDKQAQVAGQRSTIKVLSILTCTTKDSQGSK